MKEKKEKGVTAPTTVPLTQDFALQLCVTAELRRKLHPLIKRLGNTVSKKEKKNTALPLHTLLTT